MNFKVMITVAVAAVAAIAVSHAETLPVRQAERIRDTALLDLFKRSPDAAVHVRIERKWTSSRADCWEATAEVQNAGIPGLILFVVCRSDRRHSDVETQAAWEAFLTQPTLLPTPVPEAIGTKLPSIVHSLIDVMHWAPTPDIRTRGMKNNFTVSY